MATPLEVVIIGDNRADPAFQEAESGVNRIAKAAGGTLKAAFAIGAAGAAAAGAAIAGVAVKGVQEFTKFEDQMGEVFTLLPGISEDAMGKMSDQVLALSRDVGRLPEEVIPALYQSLSAGVPPDNVFGFMETAHKAALGGVTELETAVDGITSVINAYGTDVISAAEASDLMFTAVRLGKTNFDELSRSLFNVNPIASALGVQFGDVTAALANMTAQGVPTKVATTQLRQLMVELSKSGGEAATAFEEMAGSSFQDFIAEGGNVADALEIMQAAADKQGVALQDMFGSVEAGAAALALGGENIDSYRASLEEMANSTGATQAAADTMNESFARVVEVLQAQFKTALIEVGDALAPLVETVGTWLVEMGEKAIPIVVGAFESFVDIVETVTEVVGSVVAGFSDLAAIGIDLDIFDKTSSIFLSLSDAFEETHPTLSKILGGLGELVGMAGDVIGFISDAASGAGTLEDALADLPGPLQDILQGLQPVIERVRELADAIGQRLGPILERVGDIFNDFIGDIQSGMSPLEALQGAINNLIDLFQREFPEAATAIENAIASVQTAWDTIVRFFEPTIARIQEAFSGMATEIGTLGPVFDDLWQAVQGFWRAAEPVINAIGTVVASVVGVVVDLLLNSLAATFEHLPTVIGGVVTTLTGIIETITAVVTGVVEIVTSLLEGDFAGAWEAAKDMVDGIVAGLTTVLDGLLETLGGVFSAIFDTVVNTIQDILSFLTGKESDFGDRARAWLENIKSAIANFDLGAIGASIIDGIKAGLENAKEALFTFIASLMDDLIQWALDKISGGSPALEWVPVGASMVQGVAKGIEEATVLAQTAAAQMTADTLDEVVLEFAERLRPFINAIKELAKDVSISGVEEFMGALLTIALTIQPVIDAVQKLKSLGSVEGVGRAVENFALISRTIVGRMDEAATDIEEDLLEHVTGMVNTLTAIGEMIPAVVAGLESLSELQVFEEMADKIALFGGYADKLVDEIHDIEDGLADIAVPQIAAVADAVKKIGESITPIVEGLTALIGLEATGEQVSTAIARFAVYTEALVSALALAAFRIGEEGVMGAEQLGAAADSIFSSVSGAIEALTLLAESYLPPVDRVVFKFITFSNHIQVLVQFLGQAALNLGEEAITAAADLADSAGQVAAMVGGAIDALILISDTHLPPVHRVALNFLQFRNNVQVLVDHMGQAGEKIGEDALAAARDFADSTGAIADMLDGAIDVMLKLIDADLFISGSQIKTAFDLLAENIIELVTSFGEAVQGLDQEVLADADLFAKNAQSVVALVGDGITALHDLVEFEFMENMGDTARLFAENMGDLISAIVAEMRGVSDFAKQLLADAAGISDDLVAVLDVVAPGVEAIKGLAEAVQVDNLEALSQRFANQLTTIVTALTNALAAAARRLGTGEEGSLVGNAAAISGALIQVLAIIEPGLAAISALSEVTRVSKLEEKVRIFGNQFKIITTSLVNTLAAARRNLGDDAIAAALDISAAATSISRDVADTVGAFQTIAEADIPDIGENLDQMIAQTNLMTTMLSAAAGNLDETVVTAAASFAEHIRLTVDSFLDAIGHLSRFATADAPGSLKGIMSQIIQVLADAAGDAYIQGVNFGSQFVQGVRDAIAGLGEANLPSPGLGLPAAGTAAAQGAGWNLGGIHINATISDRMTADEFTFRVIEVLQELTGDRA